MNRFIRNLFYMGFQKVLIWLIIIAVFYFFLILLKTTLQDVFILNLSYLEPFIYIFCFVVFVYGIYKYYEPRKDKK